MFAAFFIVSLFFVLIIGFSKLNIAILIPNGIKETGFSIIETENIEQSFNTPVVDLAIKEPLKILGEVVSKNKNKVLFRRDIHKTN